MVHFPTLSSTAYVFSGGFSRISRRGFPHSEIPGSKPICGSPGLIAAYRVLHRLLMPRHSPYTLSSLTIRNSNLHLRASDFRLQATGTCVPKAQGPEPRACMRKFYAHCVCVVGKNYRLQDIQLSKNPLPPRSGFGVTRPRLSSRNLSMSSSRLTQPKPRLREASKRGKNWWRIPVSNR